MQIAINLFKHQPKNPSIYYYLQTRRFNQHSQQTQLTLKTIAKEFWPIISAPLFYHMLKLTKWIFSSKASGNVRCHLHNRASTEEYPTDVTGE